MRAVAALANLGELATVTACLILIMGICLTHWEWTCPMCGKETQGNIIQFLFQLCDHGGNFS